MKNEDIKLIKTDSGTDWEAYQVVKTDTARWVEDDSQEINTSVITNRNSNSEVSKPSPDTFNHIKQVLVEIQSDIVLDRPKDAFVKCAELYRELNEVNR